MIKNRDAPTFDELVKMLSSGENLPDRYGGGATDAERVAAHADLVDIITRNPDGIRTKCNACGADVPLREAFACTCGGWICAACVAIEGEGSCDHERPVFLEDDDS